MAWLPRPVCQWLPTDEASAKIVADRLFIEPVVLSHLGGADLLNPTALEAASAPQVSAAPAVADRGVLIIGSYAGDHVRVGGRRQAAEVDGAVVYRGKEGRVNLQIEGGGRLVEVPAFVAAGHATWVGIEAPAVTRVLFGANEAVMDDVALAVAKALVGHAGTWRFSVIGSYSPEGDIARNLELARARAAATLAALVAAGLEPSQVELGQPEPPIPGLSVEAQRAAEVRPVPQGAP
jgi:hypothetical protein